MSNTYEAHREAFLRAVDAYEDEDFAQYDETIRQHYRAALANMEKWAEGELKREVQRSLPALFERMREQVRGLAERGPIQTFVIDFNEAHSWAYLSAYGAHKEPVRDDHLPLANKVDNCVFEEVGPFRFEAHEQIRDELLSEPDLETDYDLCGELSAALQSLFLKRVLLLFGESTVSPDWLACTQRVTPCHVFVSIHDGEDVLIFREDQP